MAGKEFRRNPGKIPGGALACRCGAVPAGLPQDPLGTSAAGATAVVVLLDADAPEEARRAFDVLAGRVRQRVLVRLADGTDPGGLDHAELWRRIDEAARGQGVDLLALGGPVQGGRPT
jgi:hypothetical protein